jgi:hypothetical protein
LSPAFCAASASNMNLFSFGKNGYRKRGVTRK